MLDTIRPSRPTAQELTAALSREGFATTPLLGPGEVTTLRACCGAVMTGAASGFFTSVLQPPDLRRRAHEAIRAVLAPVLAPLFGEARIVLASVVARSPGSDRQDLPLHQDWSFVDEARARSISVWVPLQDVSSGNGCMQVVPRSHLHDQPLRAIGSGFRYAGIEDVLRRDHLVDVPLAAGDALVFDHRLIHGSHANASPDIRMAVGAVLLPRDEPLHLGIGRGQDAVFADRPDAFLLEAELAAIARGR